MRTTTALSAAWAILVIAVVGCGDAERHQSHTTCFLPADMESNRDVDVCPGAWSDETVEEAMATLSEAQSLQNIAGPDPEIVDYEGAPWLMSCCYTVYTADDSSWPLVFHESPLSPSAVAMR